MTDQRRCLLLTATVSPSPGIAGSRHTDVDRRLAEYRVAIADAVVVATSVGARVVVTENSGASLADLVPDRGDRSRVEFDAASASDPAEVRAGKGYAEMRLVAGARRRCPAVAEAALVWKLTGRYRVRNLAALIRATPRADLTVNLRRHPRPWADLWVWSASPRGLDALEAHVDALREAPGAGEPAEVRMFGVIQRLRTETLLSVCPRLPIEPRISGVRGWDGRPYDDVRQRAKWAVRTVARRVAPGLWV